MFEIFLFPLCVFLLFFVVFFNFVDLPSILSRDAVIKTWLITISFYVLLRKRWQGAKFESKYFFEIKEFVE